jgi:hypothetical protein
MAIIWPCPLTPSTYAAAGRDIAVPAQRCPQCGRTLWGWGGYWRWVRPEREHRPEERPEDCLPVWVRRGRCASCGRTHALTPSFLFQRRLDAATVVGAALAQTAQGSGARAVAEQLAVPHSTARDWWRRVRARAPALLAELLALATGLDPAPVQVRADGVAGIIQALESAWQRAHGRLGGHTPGQWELWSLVSGGLALGANRSPPSPWRRGGDWMRGIPFMEVPR